MIHIDRLRGYTLERKGMEVCLPSPRDWPELGIGGKECVWPAPETIEDLEDIIKKRAPPPLEVLFPSPPDQSALQLQPARGGTHSPSLSLKTFTNQTLSRN